MSNKRNTRLFLISLSWIVSSLTATSATNRVVFGFVRPPTISTHSLVPFDQKGLFAISRPKPNFSNKEKEETTEQQESISSLTAKLNQIVANRMQEEEEEEEDIIRLQLLYTRLQNLRLNRTHVGPSTIPNAGRGLFASHNVSKGELLTCYPGDALVLLPSSSDDHKEGRPKVDEWTVLLGEHVLSHQRLDNNISRWFLPNLIHVQDDTVGIVGLPILDNDTAYLGHFCNDGVSNDTIPTNRKECARYVLSSNEKANAVHQDVAKESHMVTIATRNIQKGEEIFVSYGSDYWMLQPTNKVS